MTNLMLDEHNAQAISRAHGRCLMPPEETEPEVEEKESRLTASEAKRWADLIYSGRGAVALVWRKGRLIHSVGFTDDKGDAVPVGEGETWDEAVARAGGDPEEIAEIRERGQG